MLPRTAARSPLVAALPPRRRPPPRRSRCRSRRSCRPSSPACRRRARAPSPTRPTTAGLPRRPPARHARALQRRRARGVPRHRRDGAALLRPARHVPRPDVRHAGADRRAAAELLQGLELRRARRPGRADLLPARGRHDRARPRLRRAAHLRRHARRRDVRARLRGRRGPAVLHGRPAPRGPRASSPTSRAARNAAMDAEQWEVAPYTEADLERQATQLPDFLGADGSRSSATSATTSPASTRTSPRRSSTRRKLPGEYAAIGRPQGPSPGRRPT